MSSAQPIIDVHTPSTSFAVVHSVSQESLQQLYDKLSRKSHTDFHGARVGPGWLKYSWNDTIWSLDDDSDYTIFGWRLNSTPPDSNTLSPPAETATSTSTTPTLHLRNPLAPLPTPPSYRNPHYYLFQLSRAHSPSSRAHSTKSLKAKSVKEKKGKALGLDSDGEDESIPKFKREFQKFHGENGVRTVIGSIGPVQNVRMLLKSGYRHVYISRKFAMKHGFIPADAAPGHYGYGGLVNIGTWPITLTPSSAFTSSHPPTPVLHGERHKLHAGTGPKPTQIAVYLSEEPHFDVVLGRSFFEKRAIKTSVTDMTDVVCLDTGERVECELVVLRDGKGEIVSVT